MVLASRFVTRKRIDVQTREKEKRKTLDQSPRHFQMAFVTAVTTEENASPTICSQSERADVRDGDIDEE